MSIGNRTAPGNSVPASAEGRGASGIRIGLDLGGTKCAGALFDREYRELVRLRVPTPSGDYAGTLQAVAGLVAALQEKAPEPVGTVGIGMPGILDPQTGLVKNCNATWIQGKAFDVDLESVLGLPVRVANDGNCFTIAEALYGAGKDARVVFGATLGTGVGGGVVVNRKLINGRHGIGGEWGHSPLSRPTDEERRGRRCFCGQLDCVEQYLSGGGLAPDYQELSGRAIQAPELPDLLAAGDPAAEKAMARYEDRLGRALVAVVSILDPDVVVLGGGVSNIVRLYRNVPPLIAKYTFSDPINTLIVRARHGDSGGVLGAALLWQEQD